VVGEVFKNLAGVRTVISDGICGDEVVVPDAAC